ncbi:hypothetical protein OY671_012431, partial [Metschnikowia pulcherrima]
RHAFQRHHGSQEKPARHAASAVDGHRNRAGHSPQGGQFGRGDPKRARSHRAGQSAAECHHQPDDGQGAASGQAGRRAVGARNAVVAPAWRSRHDQGQRRCEGREKHQRRRLQESCQPARQHDRGKLQRRGSRHARHGQSAGIRAA